MKSAGLAPPSCGLLTFRFASPVSLIRKLALTVVLIVVLPKSIGPGAAGFEPKAGCGTVVPTQVRL